jgi:hypothetical protein
VFWHIDFSSSSDFGLAIRGLAFLPLGRQFELTLYGDV